MPGAGSRPGPDFRYPPASQKDLTASSRLCYIIMEIINARETLPSTLEESTSAENGSRPVRWLTGLFDRWGLFPPDPGTDAANWERYMPIGADDAVAMLRRGLPGDAKVTLSTREDGTGSIQILDDE